MNDKYEDIINMPHHISKKHPPMGIEVRAAQFAPFAALTGYEDAVEETGRITDKKIDLDEEAKKILDKKINLLQNIIKKRPNMTVMYFKPDLKKTGGKYITVNGDLKKIDEYNQKIILNNNQEIKVCDIMDIIIN